MRPLDPIRSATSSRRWPRIGGRAPVSAGQSGAPSARSAGSVLGRDHPLARAIDATESIGRQWWACAAVDAGALIAQLEDHPWAVAVTISAALVLLTLTVVLLALRQRTRDEAIRLISDGREALPIAVVQRQRQLMLSRRTREALARTLETMLRQAVSPPRITPRGGRSLFSGRVIASVAPDLRAVIGLLRTDTALARGVALTERLIAHGDSPFYARDASALREELRRIRSSLEE
jgi:hypothetical protein